MFKEKNNNSCRNKISKCQESLFKNVHVLSYENVNHPKRILNSNTCKYYNSQSQAEYKKNYKILYNVNHTQNKNHKNKYFYTYDSDTSLTDANVTKINKLC